jgi:hypothetical protein
MKQSLRAMMLIIIGMMISTVNSALPASIVPAAMWDCFRSFISAPVEPYVVIIESTRFYGTFEINYYNHMLFHPITAETANGEIRPASLQEIKDELEAITKTCAYGNHDESILRLVVLRCCNTYICCDCLCAWHEGQADHADTLECMQCAWPLKKQTVVAEYQKIKDAKRCARFSSEGLASAGTTRRRHNS